MLSFLIYFLYKIFNLYLLMNYFILIFESFGFILLLFLNNGKFVFNYFNRFLYLLINFLNTGLFFILNHLNIIFIINTKQILLFILNQILSIDYFLSKCKTMFDASLINVILNEKSIIGILLDNKEIIKIIIELWDNL
jgi:hypothetical protein